MRNVRSTKEKLPEQAMLAGIEAGCQPASVSKTMPPKPEVTNFLCKGPDGKSFRLCSSESCVYIIAAPLCFCKAAADNTEMNKWAYVPKNFVNTGIQIL